MSARVYCVTGTRSPLSTLDRAVIGMVWNGDGLDDNEGRDELHHGGAKGVDLFVADLASSYGYRVEPHEADWDRFGKGAGPIRNRAMLDVARPDKLFAFPRKGLPNRGTLDCVEAALERYVNVLVTWLWEVPDA